MIWLMKEASLNEIIFEVMANDLHIKNPTFEHQNAGRISFLRLRFLWKNQLIQLAEVNAVKSSESRKAF